MKELEQAKTYCDEITHNVTNAMKETRFERVDIQVDGNLTRTITYKDPKNNKFYEIVVREKEGGQNG
jgi:viroplasmin and RNaseH domain-containing protein